MSKSLGNVIDPVALAEEYSPDALRYFLARHVPPFEDSDFTMERFINVYNADLANGLGNLVSRTLNMMEQYDVSPPAGGEEAGVLAVAVNAHVESLAFDKALAAIWDAITRADELVEQAKPWELAKKGETEALAEVLSQLYVTLLEVNSALAPFMPETHEKLAKLLAARPLKKPAEPLFARK
jgi:methionyl-tRNA synthetase